LRKPTKKNCKTEQSIRIRTPFGDLVYVRNVDYCKICKKTFPQGDEELKICDNIRATDDFVEIVSYVAQMVPSYGNASDLLLKTMNIDITESQIKKITDYVGSLLHKGQMEKAEASYNRPDVAMNIIPERDYRPVHKMSELTLYISMDGSCVNTRIQDENGSTWKEMKLGMTFLSSDIVKRGKTVHIENKEYVAYLGSVSEFRKLVFDSAVNAGYGKVKKVVVIGDGAAWIWNMCEELFPDAVCILDLYHLKEKIYDYGKAIFPNDSKKYTQWSEQVSWYIETDQVKKALKKIKDNPLFDKVLEKNINLHGYITNNLSRINYLDYRNKGYYVGSGMIESGNKVVVQKRLKQAGQRWSKDGAQNMVSLRALYESGNWGNIISMLHARSNASVAG